MSDDNKLENARNYLESCVQKYKIFIDTCSLMDSNAEMFWKEMVPLLKRYQKYIIVPKRCEEEIARFKQNKSDITRAAAAHNAHKMLRILVKDGLVQIRGEETDGIADNVFIAVATKFRMKYNMLLITQDKALAKEFEALGDSIAVSHTKKIIARRINNYGFISPLNNNAASPSASSAPHASRIADSEKFRIMKRVTSVVDKTLPVSRIPSVGEIVNTSKGQMRLTDLVAAGGEGAIYGTNSPFVAKIYKAEKLTTRRRDKIMLMLSHRVECPGVCWPTEALTNSAGEFVGYLMPKASGRELQKSIFIKPLFQRNFPHWKKRDTVQLCVTILEKIKYLHDRNIIIGDINPLNIMVSSPTDVHFVDTDSYQIEDFPCPVGTVNYTAPEIQRKDYGTFLRTMGNEQFAVATLLFMIMLPGKPPYSQQGGDDPISNIMRMDFSYPFGENSNKKTPDGSWRFIWSHLTYKLKEAFYETFRQGEKHSTEDNRISDKGWLAIFNEYLQLLDSGKFGEQDKMSEEIFPTRFKKNPKLTYVQCNVCGQEIEESHCTNGICFDCRDKVEETRICISCGTSFDITYGEYDYFMQNGLELPKRCKECRDAKKQGNE